MDDELEDWMTQWQALDVAPVAMVAKARSLRRWEARSWVATVGVALVGAAGLAVVLWSLARSLTRGGFFSGGVVATQVIAWIGLVILGAAVLAWWRRVRRERRRLTDTPVTVVEDLIATRKRQIFWTGDKRVWGPAAAFLIAVAVASLVAGYEYSAAGRSATALWGAAVMYVTALVITAIYSVFRLRFLRRELSALAAIREELDR